MKKVLLMFAFIATLLVGSIGTAGAQVNYTVYDGTNTSSQVPVYGYYCDNYLKCEYVIPADHLTAINGSTISALKFYSSTASADWGSANFRVFLKEVAGPTISNYSGYADATEVYMGSLSISDYEMVVNFTTNYTYNGGNLLIGFYNETKGSWVSASFYGKNINGSCVQGNASNSLSNVTANQRNFIPKTTFTVDELHGCLTPTNLAVSDVTTYGATVTWTPGNTETDWVVKFNDDEYPVSGTPSYTVTGLTPNTSYVASVKAVCGGTEESEYTTPGVLFTTLPTCPAPTAVTVSNVTAHTADIAWTNGGDENAWTIDYNGTEVSATTNPFTLTGLNAATSYTVKVKANCSEEDESDWSSTASLLTECETFMVTENAPYQEGFEGTTFPPTCWSQYHTVGTSTNTWGRNTYTVHTGNGSAQLQDQQSGNINDLVTGMLNIPEANTYQVNFWMQRSNYSTLKPNEGVKVWVNTTPDTVGGTEIMYIHREYTLAPAEEATGWYEYSALIPTSGDMYVIFQGISEWGQSSYIDDITVNKAPSCLKPTAVTVSNVTAHTADIAWTNGGTEPAWTIDYNGTEIAADSNPFTLTGLDAATNYTVKVKANCSEESESEWSTIVNFLTECETNTTFPYVQDFEATTFPPTCWSQSRTSEGNSGYFYGVDYPDGAWTQNASIQNGNATGKAQLRDTRAGSIHALVTGAMDFTYENGYILSVDVCRNATGTSYLTEGIRIFVNSEPEVNANATELAFISRNHTVASTVNPDIVGTETASGWYTYELPITATGVNYIIFQGESQYGNSTYMDNVRIGEVPTCPKPTGVTISNVTAHTADIAWTAAEETEWVLSVNGEESVIAENPYTLTGLTPVTNYSIALRAICSATDTSEWSNTVAFTTTVSCPAPTAVTVSNITENTADIAWTNGGDENAWIIDLNGSEITATTNPFPLTGLDAATSYTVKVKAVCSEEDESNWSTTADFRTACDAVVVDDMNPMVEGFEENDLGCWTSEIIAGTYNWAISTSYPHSGNHSVYFNYGGLQARLISPVMDLTGITTQPRLSFYHRQSSWYGSVDAMDVYYRTAADADWTFLANYSTEYAVMSYDELILPNPTATYQIAFVSNADDNYGIYLDDITVDAAPSCLKPTAVTVSNVTAHTADIAWTNGGTETAWTIDYNGTEIAADSNPFILTGLDAATSYTVKVKANCTEESASDWSYTTSFTTECEANTTFPYVQDFEATTFPPICWFQTRLAGSATSTDYANGAWARYGYSNGSNTTAQAQLRDDRAGNLHQLITGAQEFTYAGGYILSVDVYRNTSSYATEGIRIYVNNEPTVNANATELAFISRNYTVASTVNSDIVGAETASGWYTYELPITATGVNYIIFQGESQYGSSTYMDNVIIDETPTCPKPTAVTVSNITETTAEIAWTENGTAEEWTIEYNGTEVSATTNPFTLTGLDASTLYTVKVKANCSDDDESDWSTEVSFRTECGTIVVTDENPFLEGFEGSDFGCWTTEQVAGTANWELSTSYASEGNKSAKFPWTTNAEGRLISPILDLTQLTNSFVKFGHNQPAFSGAADELHLYYRASASDDWTLLQSFTTPTTGFAEEEIALPNPSATYQICFHGKGLDKLAIYVDNVFVGAYIPCLTPTAVVVSNETETSADVDWTAGNQETAWNIRYRPVSNSVFFDFEDGMQGWTTLNTDGDEYVFVHSSENIGEYDYTSFGHNGSNGFAVSNSYIDYVGEVNANQYLVAPNAITADSVTSLNFYYDFGNDTYPDYFEAGIFTQDPTDTTNFTSLWNSQDRGAANTNRSTVRHTEPTRYNNWREVTIDLSEYAGQQVWIAFHHQDYDNYELWLDDITIGELPSEWTVVEGVTNPYTIEGLTANTTYEVQVQAACSEDEASDWTASVEFTTLAADTTVEEPCATPANIAVENNVVTWESEAANFNIMIVANGDTTNATAAGNTYTVEGFENGTEVVVLVQAICDEDNLSDWTEGFTFTYETTGINNYSINVKVYPNPTTGLINVDCAAINADVTVYDMFGKLMMTSKIANERTELDFSAFAPGMYIVRIADANNSTNVKVVKK